MVREQPTIHRSGAPSTAMSMVYFGDIQGLSREEGRRRRRNTHIYQQPLSFHPTSTHLPTYLPRLPTYLTYIVTSLGDPCKGGIQSAIPRVAQCCTGTINKTATTKVKPVDNSRGHPIRLRNTLGTAMTGGGEREGGGGRGAGGDSENGREAPASPGEIHLIGGKSTVVSISATHSTRQSQSQVRHALRDAMVGAASPAPPRRSTDSTSEQCQDLAPWIYLAKTADRPKTQECGRGSRRVSRACSTRKGTC